MSVSFDLYESEWGDETTLQNFIYKHTVDLENVQREITEWAADSVMSPFNYAGNALTLGPHPSYTKTMS
jgi:hypothetical protein